MSYDVRKKMPKEIIRPLAEETFDKQTHLKGEKAKRMYIEGFVEGYLKGCEMLLGQIKEDAEANNDNT